MKTNVTRDQALSLLMKYNKESFHILHGLTVEGTMRWYARELGYGEDEDFWGIAGLLHDVGNCINRSDHAHSGALMAMHILQKYKLPPRDTAVIISAIGQHDEGTGSAVDPVSAAVILADKTDVRRNRVRNPIRENFDKHDRVNYAAISSALSIHMDKKIIQLNIELDEEICSIMDYFEIFMQRMLMCKRASEMLGMKFKLMANGNKIC